MIDRLHSASIRKLADTLIEDTDVVILDCPPVLGFLDTFVMASHADNVILVLETRKTRANDMLSSIERLEPTGANIIGVILNQTKIKKKRWKILDRFTNRTADPAEPVVVSEEESN